MKRYQIVTYCRDCGLDDKSAFEYLLDAHRTAKNYISENYDEVYIIDLKDKRVAYLYNGYFVPENYFSADYDTRNTVIFTPETIKKGNRRHEKSTY